jgi:Ca-activated chloride channel homolog
VSDGEDNGDGWPAVARQLRDAQVIVHTVGVGTPEGAPLPDPQGGVSAFKLDRQGRQVVSRLEPEILQRIANASGGIYHEVRTPHAEIAPLRDAILRMEGTLLGTDTLVRRQDRFQWFLGAAAALLALQLLVGPFGAGGRAR